MEKHVADTENMSDSEKGVGLCEGSIAPSSESRGVDKEYGVAY